MSFHNMIRVFGFAFLVSAAAQSRVRGDGMLVPTDRSVPPLVLQSQQVRVSIEGPAATTTVEQVYRNNTSRVLEAEYLFPLPKGAAVREFAMWVGGKRLSGETVPADKARRTYEDIVRRLKDPGLLEYVGTDLWKVRVYPIPARGDQKIEIKYLTVLKQDNGMYEYLYPLRTASARGAAEGSLTLVAEIKSQRPLGPIYSPSHSVAVDRKGENTAIVSFEQSLISRSKDFQLFFSPKESETGFSLLTHRPNDNEPGYYLLLLSPKTKSDATQIPRDLVVVLDTSGSMAGEKIQQAKRALKSAIDTLLPTDRFALFQFATVVGSYRETLESASPDNLKPARDWVEKLEAMGGTDIASALDRALDLKSKQGESGRTFQILFLTDGLPTIGTTDPGRILRDVQGKNSAGTRVFCFGVGDDVNTHLLDQISESSRAVSTYVRPAEDIEVKVSALLAKIRHPVRTDLKLTAAVDSIVDSNPSGLHNRVSLSEIYPPQLPDLFAGEQLQIVGRYVGSGGVKFTLEGKVGQAGVTETFQTEFPKQESARDFVAQIWARRKIGYLLDQIRINGEKAEVRDEVIRLSTRFGIATPYTSFLIVPDEMPIVSFGAFDSKRRTPRPRDVRSQLGGGMGGNVDLDAMSKRKRSMAAGRMSGIEGGYQQQASSAGQMMANPQKQSGGGGGGGKTVFREPGPGSAAQSAERLRKPSENSAVDQRYYEEKAAGLGVSSGKDAVDMAQSLDRMKGAHRADPTSVRTALGKRFEAVEDVWVDETFKGTEKSNTLRIAFLSDAYFAMLDRHPELKDLFALGERIVWVSPSGKVVVIEEDGESKLGDDAIDALFHKSEAKTNDKK